MKYHPENILEYTNYETQDKSSNLLSDYETAIDFIKRDECVTNSLILKKYVENANQNDFYFDYVINNMPIEIDNETAKDIKLNNFIYVSVKNGMVSKYKKIAFNFKMTDDFSQSKPIKYIYKGDSEFLSQF